MGLFTRAIARRTASGQVPSPITYDDLLRVSKDIMRGRSSSEQRLLIRDILFSLLPPGLPALLR